MHKIPSCPGERDELYLLTLPSHDAGTGHLAGFHMLLGRYFLSAQDRRVSEGRS